MNLLTPVQRKRAVEDAKVAERFKAIKKQHPTVSDTRIMSAMAEEGTWYTSLSGIRQSLKRSKVI